MAAHYDDTTFSYLQYWQGRNYEHNCEVIALETLLKGKTKTASDIGGGYGRLSQELCRFADKVTLVEPSLKQRKIAAKFLPVKNKITIASGIAKKTGLPSNSQDIVIMVRVMHHLPHPDESIEELYRILKPGGKLILEFANSYHFKARLASIFSGRPILPIPIDRRSNFNIKRQTIPFVNHHPKTVLRILEQSGFTVKRILSVSNFRSPFLKKVIPLKLLLGLERKLQLLLARFYFGPSIFLLATK